MKKIYTLAMMALVGVASANAQAFKLDRNYVLTTSMKVADGTTVSPGFAGDEIGGGCIDKISEAFLDAEYNTLPISGGTAAGANYHILKNDYTDAETGIAFKAGTYACLNSNTELKFKDTFNPQGVSNIKKVIFYLASQGQLQAYARQYTGTSVDNDYCHFEGDPTNRKLNPYYAPGFETTTWTEMSFNKPLKLVLDLTNNQNGTTEELTAGTIKMTMGGDTELVNMLYQFYEKATGPDGTSIIQGEKLIPWTADSKFVISFKKKAYVMGVALICGDADAKTAYLDITAENPQWTENAPTAIENVTVNGVENVNDNKIYSIDGRYVGTEKESLANGLYIQNGKKFIKNK